MLSGENLVNSSENCGKQGILKILSCHHVWLSHLTPAMVGGALSQPVLHWASQEAPYGSLKTGAVFCHHCNELPMISAVKLAWSTKIEEPKFCLHGRNWGISNLPCMNNTLFFQIIHSITPAQLFPWLEPALSIYSAWVAGRATLATLFFKQGFLPNKTCFLVSHPWIKVNRSWICWCCSCRYWNWAGQNEGSK